MTELVIRPGRMTLSELRGLWRAPMRLALDPGAKMGVDAAAAVVAQHLDDPHPTYGVNTGFGLLASTRIPLPRLRELQRRLVLSHSAGLGELLPAPVVRLMVALKANSLARGHSGVRWETIEALAALANSGVTPCIPAKGSVGASGDLAPLAHLAAALIGVGEVERDGVRLPAAQALAPIELGPKEGLALLNGTQASTALALAGLFALEDAFAAAVVAGALSTDAMKGSDAPFDPRIQAVRGHRGQIDAAAAYAALMQGSQIRQSHVDCGKVQDPYSLRCQPQVMGACLDQLRAAAATLLTEANAVSDNPLVFPEEGEILSGGNFHAEPVALAADALALACAEIGNLAERRIALLVDPKMSGLPAFLVADSGVNSGFMIAQVTAAALASENKQMSHPASADTIPTSANQEDHVSMATHAARRLCEMADNLAGIVAIELLCAAQGLEFHRPMRSSTALEEAVALVRREVPRWEEDRFLHPDLLAAKALVQSAAFRRFLPRGLLPSD